MASSNKPLLDLSLAPRLLELCRARDITFSDLARRTDISRTTLTRILKGQRQAHPFELSRILRVLRVRQRDFFSQPPTPEQTAELVPPPAAPPVDVQDLEHQLHLAIEQRDDLADQVERLCAELRVERSERVNELAELRHQHMQEIVELRRSFQEEQMKTLEDAQTRDEKASAALGAAMAELNRRAHPTAQQEQREGQSPHPNTARPSDSSPPEGRPSWGETAAGIATGLGGLALGTWLLASKRS